MRSSARDSSLTLNPTDSRSSTSGSTTNTGPANMDVDGSMVVAVEEKRVAFFFENLRHHLSVHDRGLGAPLRRGLIAQRVPGRRVRLPRPFAENSSGTPCDLLRDDADWGLSRFLAENHFFPTNSAVVTNPTRGAFFAG